MTDKKKPVEKVNSLDYAKKLIMATILTTPAKPMDFRTKGDIEKFLQEKIPGALTTGDFAYDPNQGEITISVVMDISMHDIIEDGKSVGGLIREILTEEGWKGCTIIPGRIGVHATLLRLSHPTITSTELLQQGTRVSRSMDKLLSGK